jgi:flagellar basal body-associated protein FliL
MATKTAEVKSKNMISVWLIIALALVIVVCIVFTTASNSKHLDPTLTAAPPIIATPGHPIVPSTKSAAALAEELRQDGLASPNSPPGQAVTK